ncbi:MAG TPA: Hsp70 family protein, partial [Vicinamibacteria bacterium]|nr:Hsp70 family protein [Vicinamibacteria bacterium]
YARLRQEALLVAGGKPLHFDREVSRDEYEALIRPLVESTLVSVTKALDDSHTRAADLDAILLVGGSTRTPLVARTLQERTGIEPHREVHPDLCVALGAGVLAARLGGSAVERVLVDVSPFSFGPSHLGLRGGAPYPHCYRPVIARNTPLPVTRVESYQTCYAGQDEVEIEVYQGEDEDALRNIPVGDFRIVGLDRNQDDNEILCRMSLDLDGLLRVAAIERHTGKSKEIVIRHALTPKTPEEVAAARERLERLFEGSGSLDAMFDTAADDEATSETAIPGSDAIELEASAPPDGDGGWSRTQAEALAAIERSRAQLPQMHEEDREEAIDLHERIETALDAQDGEALGPAIASLKELLFFIEGR